MCFLFKLDKNSGCYCNLYIVPIDLQWEMRKLTIFFVSLGIFGIFFTEMFIEYSSTFCMTFVQIGEFDWLFGGQNGSIFVKMFKNLLLRNHLWDEAETWH